MSTDFFTSQDHARKQTGRLVFLFIAGVVATMASLWAVLAFALSTQRGPEAWTDPRLALGVLVGVGGIVTIVTLFKLSQLSQGGEKIAQMLGGTRIPPTTFDPAERQLLNIVEEMSIASGVPVPPVYVMEDKSINAFAAGPDPSRSVIGVTRGLMDKLNRDEIQGVVAHEYSHIFHGDTRINARTTAVIAGIMAVGVLGYVMFRYIGPTLARSGGRGKNNPGPAIGAGLVVLGLAVWGIGSLGMLFGRLIQAAISRQREFLADAAAVQYTRNPDGIAGALAKIRDHSSARLESPAASELNHFFFCTSLNTMFATHPPIDERIKRLAAMGAVKTAAASASAAPRPSPTRRGAPPPPLPPRAAVAAVGLAGTLEPQAITRAHDWLERLPRELADAARRSDGARAICYLIARHESAPAYRSLAASVARQTSVQQLALADLASPALAALGRQGYSRFRSTLGEVMRSDAKIDLREWALAKSLERHVERRFLEGPSRADRTIANMPCEASVVLAIIAITQHRASEQEFAYQRGGAHLGLARDAKPDPSLCTLDALNDAVRKLSKCRFIERERLLEACAITAMSDGSASETEILVVRAVADALDVPIPPLAAA
ncbi:MAG: M48 family metallopeptidase [Planctomycetota bacterium]|nr:M48 family metallopeptidase [Planctomycetota bacterium]